MALICGNFYTSVYMGEPVDQADFPSLVRRAEDAVGALTGYQVTEDNFDSLPPIVRTLYRKAICAQIEYLQEVGVSAAITGENGMANGFTVGKVHVGGTSGHKAATASSVLIAPAAVAYLEQTGLLSRHVGVLGDCPVWGWA